MEELKPLPHVPGLLAMWPDSGKRGYFIERARGGNPVDFSKWPLVLDWTVPGFEWETEDKEDVGPTGELLFVNMMTNKAHLGFNHDWHELWGALEGKTAIICSPGPSLRHHLPTVNQALAGREDICIFALNRAMRSVIADYCMAMDRNCHPDLALHQGVRQLPKWDGGTRIEGAGAKSKLISCQSINPLIALPFKDSEIYWG